MGAIRVAAVSLLGLAAAAEHSCGGAEGHAGVEPQDCDALDLMQRTRPARSELVPEALLGVSGATPFERDYLQGGWAQQIYGDVAEQSEAPAMVQSGQNGTAGLKHRLVLHHIWKVGGTHLCSLARESGLRAALNPGCHFLVNSSVPDAVLTTWRPCAVQPGLADIPFDVVGHECAVDEIIISKAEDAGFRWVGMLRDPIQQVFSWYNHAVKIEFKKQGKREVALTEWLGECNDPQCGMGFATFSPNLQTRWLAGGKCVLHPELEGCFEQALANLRRMAVVLEQDGSAVKGTEKLQKLGWTAHEQDRGFVSRSATMLGEATAAEIAYATELQHIDLRLVREARAQGLI